MGYIEEGKKWAESLYMSLDKRSRLRSNATVTIFRMFRAMGAMMINPLMRISIGGRMVFGPVSAGRCSI